MKGTIKDTYLPSGAEIIDIMKMTDNIKLFTIKPQRPFPYKPGEFIMLSLWGKGEVPISITSTYGFHKYLELCIRRVGYITEAIHMLRPSDEIGIRGPFGNSFPVEEARGKDIIFVAGGLGIAPLRPLIHMVMNDKKQFKRVALVSGSCTPSDILFKDDINTWQKKGMQVFLTCDKKDMDWDGNIGLVTDYLKTPKISFKNAFAFLCGPPVMIDITMKNLHGMGVSENRIFTSLEAHMKCGVGKCGHCYIDGKYICTEGPILSYAEIKDRRLYKH